MKRLRLIVTCCILALVCLAGYASPQNLALRLQSLGQEQVRDSLRKIIRSEWNENHTRAVHALRQGLARHTGISLYTRAVMFEFLARSQAELNEYTEAENAIDSGMYYYRRLGHTDNEARALVTKAEIYRKSLRDSQALDLLTRALNAFKGHAEAEFLVANKIGEIFKELKNTKKSFEYFAIAEARIKHISKPAEETSQSITNMYKNIGVLYRNEKQLDKALVYFNRGIERALATNNQKGLGSLYTSLGIFYKEQGDTEKALDYFNRSLALKQQFRDTKNVPVVLNNIAGVYLQQGNLPKAEEYLLQAIGLFRTMDLNNIRYADALRDLAEVYALKGDNAKAYPCLKEAFDITQTIQEKNNASDAARLEAIFKNEKNSREIEISKVKNAELSKNLSLKKKQQNMLLTGLSVLVVLLVWALWSYAGKRRANRQLEEKNKQIISQKMLVEQQHKEIVDSINYAKKIQSAILPSAPDFKKTLGSCFVFFRPKDIVSGDFYWMSEKGEHVYYATVDCTGHGVPGGFMSVLAASLLNEIVNETGLTEPDEILNTLRARVIQALRQKGETGENKDGMDMVLCRVHKQNRQLVFAAANNPLWILRPGGLTEIKPDKFPVGISPHEQTPFTRHSLDLQAGDMVYTFTDGYADQFGGEKGKKFKYANLQKILAENRHLSPEEQEKVLAQAFDSWKGNLEQVDDVCIVGIKL